jgi:dCMP deaminase
MAFLASKRSHDSETKVGCILVNKDNRVISTGYNGFCSDLKDKSQLPTTRPEKYHFMLHAEQNAICNTVTSIPDDGTKAYITKLPCEICAKLLWQCKIREWYVPEKDNLVKSSGKEQEEIINLLIRNGLRLHRI